MLKVKRSEEIVWHPGHRALSWINQNKETGEWELLYSPTTCRTYLNCYWWYSGGHGEKHKNYDLNVTPLIKGSPAPAEEYTGIFFTFSTDYLTLKTDGYTMFEGYVETVKKNLESLHQWEEENGLEKTQMLVADDPTGMLGIIFIGDKAWRSALWKITLYSYLLKRTTYASFLPKGTGGEEYWNALKKKGNIHKLLPKVKTFMTEHYVNKGYSGIHGLSGFYTICATNDNPVMTELLLGEEPKKTEHVEVV